MTRFSRSGRSSPGRPALAAAGALATVAASLAVTSSPAWADTTTTTASTTTTSSTLTTGLVTTSPADINAPLPPGQADRLGWIKADSAFLVRVRVRSLQAEITLVESKTFLGGDSATLQQDLDSDIAGLQALLQAIDNDTTPQTARADRAKIFTQFRVYLLALPVTRGVIDVDQILNVKLPAVNQEITSLTGALTSANQSVLQPLISNMQAQVGIVTAATNGLVTELYSYTPQQWDANHRLLAGATAQIWAADKALAQANRDFAQAERYLRTGHTAILRRKVEWHPGRGHGAHQTFGTTTTSSTTTTTS